jgi:hypothetical protein
MCLQILLNKNMCILYCRLLYVVHWVLWPRVIYFIIIILKMGVASYILYFIIYTEDACAIVCYIFILLFTPSVWPLVHLFTIYLRTCVASCTFIYLKTCVASCNCIYYLLEDVCGLLYIYLLFTWGRVWTLVTVFYYLLEGECDLL